MMEGGLLLSPSLGDEDGHFIYVHPELWREAMREFLVDVGMLPKAP